MTDPLYATLPTLGRDCLAPCLDALLPQVDHLWMVRTGPGPLAGQDREKVTVLDATDSPRNISAWWNLGIDAAAKAAAAAGRTQWDMLVVNDDVIAPPQLAHTLSTALRQTWDAAPALAYPDQDGLGWHLTTHPTDPTRLTGYCFLLRGELNIRADERLVWWFSDNALDMAARARGGSVRVPGCRVDHLHPSGYTVASAELSAQTHRDRAEYERIYREEGF